MRGDELEGLMGGRVGMWEVPTHPFCFCWLAFFSNAFNDQNHLHKFGSILIMVHNGVLLVFADCHSDISRPMQGNPRQNGQVELPYHHQQNLGLLIISQAKET